MKGLLSPALFLIISTRSPHAIDDKTIVFPIRSLKAGVKFSNAGSVVAITIEYKSFIAHDPYCLFCLVYIVFIILLCLVLLIYFLSFFFGGGG